MSKVAVVGYARTGSGRLPNKVLFDLGGKPAFVQIIERATSVLKPDYVFVACTRRAQDDPIELLAKQYGIETWRWSDNIQHRCMPLAEKLGLKDNDWWIGIHCDSALSLAAFLPWAMTEMERHDCQAIALSMPEGSLIRAFWVSCTPEHWWVLKSHWLNAFTIDEDGFSIEHGTHCSGVRKYLIVHWPSEYLVPWPWGPIHLDHPEQALVIKEVYRRLYKGSPIDILDVYELFKQDPQLAALIPLTMPLATNHVLPFQEQEPRIESIKQNAEYIELIWPGKSTKGGKV